MKRHVLIVVVVMAISLLVAGLAQADDAAKAKDNVQKAIAMAKEKGLEAALKAVSDPKGPFVDGEFYIWAGYLSKVQMSAHPFKPALVGKDLSGMKDTQGKLLFVEFAKVAKEKGSGWVDYMWPKPNSKDSVAKSSYVERVPGQDMYFGCGIYKK